MRNKNKPPNCILLLLVQIKKKGKKERKKKEVKEVNIHIEIYQWPYLEIVNI